MGLLTLNQIPCHHVLANEIALNLKYHIGLKHFFNINLGIGIIKKCTFFVCIFDISPRVFTQISIGRSRWMRIKFCIQRVPTRHTFDGPLYPKNKKYLKKQNDDIIISFFQVFLVFRVAGSVKSMPLGTRWMQNLIMHPTSSPNRNLSKNTRRYVENTNKKVVFSFLPLKLINIILLIFLRRSILS